MAPMYAELQKFRAGRFADPSLYSRRCHVGVAELVDALG